MKKNNPYKNEVGVIHLLALIAVIGVIVFLLISSTFSFKDNILSKLFPKKLSNAAGIVTLALSPSSTTVAPDTTFNIDVQMDTKTLAVSAVDLRITYDSSALLLTSFQKSTMLQTILQPANIASGSATLVLGSGTTAVTGVGSVATLTFKALKLTTVPALVSIDPATQIAAVDVNGNVAGGLGGSSITVGNPSVTPPPSANPTGVYTISANPDNIYQVGTEFAAKVMVLNDTDSANLFAAKLKFDPTKVDVTRIDNTGSFVPDTKWIDESFNNLTGTLSIVGGVTTPGFKTTGTSALLATVYFTPKAIGSTSISFDSTTSAIYRDSDNANIVVTPITSTMDIATINPAPLPSPIPSPIPTPLPTPVPTPIPTPSPSPITTQACAINQANWTTTANPVAEGTVVNLTVKATGDCSSKQVAFKVLEDDGILGTDDIKNTPFNATLDLEVGSTTSYIGSTVWVSEYQPDGPFGLNDPPEYFFNANIVGSAVQFKSADPELQVVRAMGGVARKGDSNRDGKVDLQDLSVLLSNWNKNQNLLDELDVNSDGVINAIDFSGFLVILREAGQIN